MLERALWDIASGSNKYEAGKTCAGESAAAYNSRELYKYGAGKSVLERALRDIAAGIYRSTGAGQICAGESATGYSITKL